MEYPFTRPGEMPMPENFPHKAVFLRGRPRHEKYDGFSVRHPSMEAGRRAKLFSPFEALRGFGDAVHRKEVMYYNKIVPGEDELEELDRRLRILRELTRSAREARERRVTVSVTYFVPCADEDNFAFGVKGSYETVTGVVQRVDPEGEGCILVAQRAIALADVVEIRAEGGLFDLDPEREVS